MLISTKAIFHSSVLGVDEKVGTIADLYFDGEHWNVRYLLASRRFAKTGG